MASMKLEGEHVPLVAVDCTCAQHCGRQGGAGTSLAVSCGM